jgi:iron complex transport system substrate-binding protein
LKTSILIIILFLVFTIYQNCDRHKDETVKERRIISLSPFITEIIYALDAGDDLIAVSDYCSWPQEARYKRKIGGLLDPNIEEIVVLKPTHIFGQPAHAELNQQLEKFGLNIIMISNEDIKDILNAIKRIGEELDHNAKATELVSAIRDSLKMIKADMYLNGKVLHPPVSPLSKVENPELVSTRDLIGRGREGKDLNGEDSFQSGIQQKDSITAILVIGRERGGLRNMTVAGTNTFIGEMWELAGGKNLYSDLTSRYSLVSLESILIRNPDVIIEFDPGGERMVKREVITAEWEILKQVKAIKKGNLFLVSGEHIFIPGPRLYLLAQDFDKLMKMAK